MTVVSLDQSFNPYDVSFGEGNTTTYDWQVNVPAGKQFTVIMNDGKGYGYGGVADAYGVNRTGGNAGCEVAGGVGTTTSRTSPTSTSVVPTSTSRAEPEGNGPPKGSVIAGTSIGAVVGIGLSAAVAFLVFFCRRRRRNRYTRGRKEGGKDAGNGIVLADGRRRPEDAMSVNLFDDSEQYHDPNDGNYAPVPYDVGASSYSGSPVTPGTGRYMMGGRGELSPSTTMITGTSNPFEGRELHGEEARDALVRAGAGDRTWSGESSLSDTLPSAYGRSTSGLQRLDTMTATGSPAAAPRIGLPRTKSEEAVAEVEAVAAAAAATRANATARTLTSYPSTEISSPVTSAGLSAGGGGFRVTNATDADPLIPSTTTANTGTATRRGPRGEPRFVRHADAGRAQEEVIDLPPLYTDLVQDDSERTRSSGTE